DRKIWMTDRINGVMRRRESASAAGVAAACALQLASALCIPAHAQDSRAVHEPVVPPSCAALSAAPTQSVRDDTARIQAALDKCARGHALHLARQGADTDFVSGPLVLRNGVTLYVDAGVTLKASTNPVLFDHGANP